MGKYDKIFNSQKGTEESLSPQEAVAAMAVVMAAASTSMDDVDPDLIADMLFDFEIFDDYSDDDMLEAVDKLTAIAEEEGLGALFNTAKKAISEEMKLDAFAAGAMMLVDEEEIMIPKGKKNLLGQLQQALAVSDEDASEVVDEVIAAFEELMGDEFLDEEDETVAEEPPAEDAPKSRKAK